MKCQLSHSLMARVVVVDIFCDVKRVCSVNSFQNRLLFLLDLLCGLHVGHGSFIIDLVHFLAEWHKRPLNHVSVSFDLVCAYVSSFILICFNLFRFFCVVVGCHHVQFVVVLHRSRDWLARSSAK